MKVESAMGKLTIRDYNLGTQNDHLQGKKQNNNLICFYTGLFSFFR